MRALIQRVTSAKVTVAGQIVGAITQGTLALVAVQPDDSEANADKLLYKLLNYRMFADEKDKMNRSLIEEQGGLLIVSQFTLKVAYVQVFPALLLLPWGNVYIIIWLSKQKNNMLK